MAAGQLENMLVPGVRDFIKQYQYLQMAVATNAEPENVDFLLDRSRLRDFFHAVVDGQQVERAKPYPDIYLRAAELLGTKPAMLCGFRRLPCWSGGGCGGRHARYWPHYYSR